MLEQELIAFLTVSGPLFLAKPLVSGKRYTGSEPAKPRNKLLRSRQRTPLSNRHEQKQKFTKNINLEK